MVCRVGFTHSELRRTNAGKPTEWVTCMGGAGRCLFVCCLCCHPLSVGILEQDLCDVHSFAPTHPPGEARISGSAAVWDAPAIPYRGHVGRARSAGWDASAILPWGFVNSFFLFALACCSLLIGGCIGFRRVWMMGTSRAQ